MKVPFLSPSVDFELVRGLAAKEGLPFTRCWRFKTADPCPPLCISFEVKWQARQFIRDFGELKQGIVGLEGAGARIRFTPMQLIVHRAMWEECIKLNNLCGRREWKVCGFKLVKVDEDKKWEVREHRAPKQMRRFGTGVPCIVVQDFN